MKQIFLKIVLAVHLFFATNLIFSQVKISDIPGGSTTINPNSILELESNNKGLLLPRLTVTQINGMANVPTGMFLFCTTDTTIYCKTDTGWAKFNPNLWGRVGEHIINLNTGNIGIGTITPLAKLHVENGSVLFNASGNFPSSPSPAPVSGAGRRMMWYADKAAFRVGYVSGNQWDTDSIGSWSIAMGMNVKAIAPNSIALGTSVEARGGVGIGSWIVNKSSTSTSIGHSSTSLGSDAFNAGNYNYIDESTYGSVILGTFDSIINPSSSRINSTVVGSYNKTNTANSLILGNQNNVSDGGGFVGVIGHKNFVTNAWNYVLGMENQLSGFNSIILGRGNRLSGSNNSIIGRDNYAYRSSVWGFNNINNGRESIAIGTLLFNKEPLNICLGTFNDTTHVPDTLNVYNSQNIAFQIGNGSSSSSRSNAITVLRNANTGIGNINNPIQKLEVAGAIKIGEAAATGLQDGTIQYTTAGFQGRHGGNWIPFGGGSSSGYWAANGSDIYNTNTASIGIGTNSPFAKAEILSQSSVAYPQLRLTENNPNEFTRLMLSNEASSRHFTLATAFGTTPAQDIFNLYHHSTSQNIMQVSGNGKIGINMGSNLLSNYGSSLNILPGSNTDGLTVLASSSNYAKAIYAYAPKEANGGLGIISSSLGYGGIGVMGVADSTDGIGVLGNAKKDYSKAVMGSGGNGAYGGYFLSENGIALYAGSSTYGLIVGGGKSGFGVTNPNQRLEVAGAIKIGEAATTGLQDGTIQYTTTGFQGRHGGNWIPFGSTSGSGSAGISYWTASGPDIYNNNAGKIGIGTANPLAKLHVADSSVVFSANGDISFTPIEAPITGAGRRMLWYTDKAAFRAGYVSGNQWNMSNVGYYSAAFGNNTIASGFASFAFGLNSSATNNNSFAGGSGAIASGDKSFAYGSSVTASADGSFALGLGSSATGTYSFAFGNNTTATGVNAFALGNNTIAKALNAITVGENNDNTDVVTAAHIPSATDRLFQIGNGTAVSRKNAVTILRNGNFGIGVLNPTYKLEVNGAVAGTLAYVNLSDKRLKKDVKTIDKALEKLMQLNGITFNWDKTKTDKELDDNNHLGFLAQDVEKIFPQAVVTANDKMQTKSVAYSDLVPVLVEAMKQQQHQIKNQQEQIDKLQKMVEALLKSNN